MPQKRTTPPTKSRSTPTGSRKTSRSAQRADERQTYKGHDIVIPSDDPGRRVLVDGEPIRYGQAGDEFYLDVYAYDRDPSLLTVVKRYIDHLEAVAARRAKDQSR